MTPEEIEALVRPSIRPGLLVTHLMTRDELIKECASLAKMLDAERRVVKALERKLSGG
jgi:hypothetical protein